MGIQPPTGTDPAGIPAGCFGPTVIICAAMAGVMPGGSFGGGAVAARADADNATANKIAQKEKTPGFLTDNLLRTRQYRHAHKIVACA